MESLSVVENPDAAACLLNSERAAIVRALREPGSASSVARHLGWPRQRVGYHVRKLEQAGLLNHIEDRRARNCVERILQASARCYALSPRVLGDLGVEPEKISDRFSSAYLIACASAAARDVSILREQARAVGKKLATLTAQTHIAFASPRDQYLFARELEAALGELVERYHKPDAPGARTMDVALLAHPHLENKDD
ncbi:MAG: helix-turn-helix domain-containing protein [Xanthomonadales bacterium]|nr:helix-turn-helix domain-containing protein [Xanthomonadales bacterium]